MRANLQLDLSEKLNAEDLSDLLNMAEEAQQPVEKVLYEGAKEAIRRRREALKNPPEVAA